MRILAIVSQKGGTGKTTTAVNLAAGLAALGRRVLVQDLDPQGSATSWLGGEEGGTALLEALTGAGSLAALVRPTETPGVSLLPSSAWLVGLDRRLAAEAGPESLLAAQLRGLRDAWDEVILDCPPSLGILCVGALAAADEVLVPVEVHVLALRGLVQMLETLAAVRDRLNPPLVLRGILACRVNRTRHAREIVDALRDRFGDAVLHTVIRETVRMAECPSFGRSILDYAPRCSAAVDYRALATELFVGVAERGEEG